MKFYLDEDLPPSISEWLRRSGVDAVSAHETERTRLADRDQLAFAASEGRALVTRNVRHFVRLAHEAIGSELPHAGIVLLPASSLGYEVAAIGRALKRLAGEYRDGLGRYDVVFLRR